VELQGLGEEEIVEMRRRGEDPNESYLDPMVAFTGDTQIEFLDSDPDVARAKILFVEATFWTRKSP
jgi:ribonuclease Z